MGTERAVRFFATACLAALLFACGVPTERRDATVAGKPGALPEWPLAKGHDLPLVSRQSRIVVKVYRGGRLAHLGHNHLLEVRNLRGRLRQLDSGGGWAELVFSVEDIVVDDPAGRSGAGTDFATQPESDAIAGTRRNMLGDKVLDAANWPEVQISAMVEDPEPIAAVAQVYVRVHGVVSRYETRVRTEARAGEVRVSGTLTLRQSDFGIEPFSVLGGALRVQDQIQADFLIVGRKSGGTMW